MKVCCDTEGRELTDERRYAPTSVPLRRKPCSRSPETLFHFTGIPSDRLDERLAKVDGVLRFRLLQGVAKKLPGAIVEVKLVFSSVYDLHRLFGLFELLLDGVAANLL